MYCCQKFFGGKYDLIQLHRKNIHQHDGLFIETITNSIFYLKFKENNENNMVVHEFVLISFLAQSEANRAELLLSVC